MQDYLLKFFYPSNHRVLWKNFKHASNLNNKLIGSGTKLKGLALMIKPGKESD
jgi:hypothetical protein